MAGHSKWSKVKHQKAVTDVIKAKAFTKASRAITIAVREGGGLADPDGNFKLRLAIEKAREVNMPKENIERAIAKGKGEGDGSIESLLYEAIGPGKVALVIEAATENRQRTVSAIKNVLDHHGGVLASQGAVLYQFERIGVVVAEKTPNISDERAFEVAVTVDASDMVPYEDVIEFYTPIPTLETLRKRIDGVGIRVNTAEIIYRPTLTTAVDETVREQVESLTEALEELDDVQKVTTNLEEHA